jgi:predicted DNA-binding transcriptional regulator YafY
VSVDVSPTARALRTLEILQTRGGATAQEIAESLGVTGRAARRYIAILREASVPIESTRGRHGGYRLGRGTKLPPVVFTQSEALGLVMAVLDGHPAASEGGDLIGIALSKVIRALPESIGRQAADLRQHAATAVDRGYERPDPVITSEVVAAAAARRCALITYRGESGEEWDGEVEPWAVVVRFGRWYLLCHSDRVNAVRTYRIDRISEVRPTTRSFTPPENLDAVAVLEDHLGTGWQFATRVVFDAPAPVVAPYVRPPMGRLEASGDGCVLVGTTRNPTMYAQEWLANVPIPFRVEAGDELRAAVATLATRLTNAVSTPCDARSIARRTSDRPRRRSAHRR